MILWITAYLMFGVLTTLVMTRRYSTEEAWVWTMIFWPLVGVFILVSEAEEYVRRVLRHYRYRYQR